MVVVMVVVMRKKVCLFVLQSDDINIAASLGLATSASTPTVVTATGLEMKHNSLQNE